MVREHETAIANANATYHQQHATCDNQYEHAKNEQQQGHRARINALNTTYEEQRSATQTEYRRIRDEAEQRYESTVRDAKEGKKQAIWQALAVFDAARNNPREALEAVQQELASFRKEADQLDIDAVEMLRMRRLWKPSFADRTDTPSTNEANSTKPANTAEAIAVIAERLATARDRVWAIKSDRALRLFEDAVPFVVLLAIWLVLLVALGFAVGWPNVAIWLGGSLAGTAIIGGVGGWLMHKRMTTRAAATYKEVIDDLAAAKGQIELASIVARDQSRREAEQLIATRDRDLADAELQASTALDNIVCWKERTLADANDTFPARLTQMRAEHQTATTQEENAHRSLMTALTAKHQNQIHEVESTKREALSAATKLQLAQRQTLRENWFRDLEEVEAAFEAMRVACARLFPDWNSTDYERWPKPLEPAEAIQFGSATIDLAKVKHALAADPDLRPANCEMEVPTLVTLREQPSLVITADGEARRRAIDLLQTIMVRFLTAMPPGKVRFTICDPVSLGENFSSFMHLADYDEGLINGRIWSESRDIDEQLTRLTEHMETILQKYLRNEYESIHEYNAQAGEVAEPFQVLAIANFPYGFSDAAARRLLSLVTGGPRCGIYVVLSHDRKQRLPNDFALEDLLAVSVHLDWDAARQRFVWRYPAFEHMPLRLAEPIVSEALVRLMKQAGKEAKDSIRVEVPFEVVVPDADCQWTETCDRELAIPIGRAGANRLQYVRLGKGTAQHLLVAGKTGSGKSTFLHALVTSGALHFSPDELEFYLVDFKKGVEFKSYATHNLPHARVIAIESEREFGLSVLERLDEELRRRGEKFRTAGVQSLGDYRADHPNEPMPRLLLVVDEFQELFVEDDKLAQEAGLLLDRLVRQGRAFGMHVLLGSQTLSGAYSLARSTLGQMAIRVALQCSEADAHLILSDERNQAARFLSRPGEAIYNDQNGLVSANQPFQVVWLPDRERAGYLAKINQLREQRGIAEREPIVFEGNAPADPQENRELMTALAANGMPNSAQRKPSAAIAWLGAAVAIKPPTSVTFARHGGSNLIVVGQQPVAAFGLLATAVVSLAAGSPDASFVVLDGTRPGDIGEGEGVWQTIVGAIGPRAQLVSKRDVPAAMERLAAELARREDEGDESAPPIYVVIFNASRFRDLRKSEDDFSFSMDSAKPIATDKRLAEILKNGPSWGIHALVWCDGYNAVTRLFDRLAMREFERRVAFQMSAADSSNLLDTPAASQLAPIGHSCTTTKPARQKSFVLTACRPTIGLPKLPHDSAKTTPSTRRRPTRRKRPPIFSCASCFVPHSGRTATAFASMLAIKWGRWVGFSEQDIYYGPNEHTTHNELSVGSLGKDPIG